MDDISVTDEETLDSAHDGVVKRVVVCTYLPMSSGAGVERFVLLLKNALQKSGIEVTVIDIDSAGIQVPFLRRFRYYCALRIGALANKEAKSDDVILCNNFFSWNARRSRSLVVFHGTDAGRVNATRNDMGTVRGAVVGSIGAFLERRTAKGRMAVAVSQSAKTEVESLYHHEVHSVVQNAVDLSLFSPSKDRSQARRQIGLPLDKFLILFVGTADPRKGLDWILKEVRPRLKSDQELVIRADVPKNQDNLIIVERLEIPDLVNLYRSCDVLLFPTRYEGCSYGLIEALACGLPVITSPAGSGRDLLDIEALQPYVLESRDPDRCLALIDRLQDSREEWERVSSACRALAERNHDLREFETAYQTLVRLAHRRG